MSSAIRPVQPRARDFLSKRLAEHAATPVPAAQGANILVAQTAALFRSPGAVVGFAIMVVLLFSAVFARLIAPQDPYDLSQLDIMSGLLAPLERMGDGRISWLGTDDQGRDMLSAIIFGMRTSLWVGAVSVVIACVAGACIGVVSAYAGGRFEAIVMRIVDLQLSLPAILVALVLLAIFGRGIDKVILALVIVQWAYYARTVRAAAIVEKEREYIEAVRCLALSRLRIVFVHLLPNCLPPLIVVATVQIAHAIILESTLSFLGVGVPVTEPSLGMLISDGYGYLLSGKYWLSTFPGAALVLVIFAINLIGDRLRVVLNPRLAA